MNILNKKQFVAIVKKIEGHKAAVAKHRDALRDCVLDLEAIVDDADEAIDGLDRALEVLSEYL